MLTSRCVSIFLLLFSAAASAFAQTPPAPPPQLYSCLSFEPENSIAWPSTGYGNAQNFGRMVVGDLDGDQTPDGVVNVGGLPVVVWGLVAYDAVQRVEFPSPPWPTAVADIAILKGGGSNGRDAVLMTDYRGLFLVKHNGTAFENPVLISDGSWANAAPIHTDDVGPDTYPDVFGISSDHKKILLCKNLGAGFRPVITVSQALTLHDVVLMNWNDAGPRELVANGVNGLQVYTATGAPFATVSHSYAPGCIVRFHASDASGSDLLAWTRGKSTGTSELLILGGPSQEGPWDLNFSLCTGGGAITPTALLAGNYDGDSAENEDLLLTYAMNQTALVLMNQGTVPHFTVTNEANFDVIPLSGAPEFPGGVGIPAFAQIDDVVANCTNPVDIAFPVSATGRVEVFTSLGEQRDRFIDTTVPDSGDMFDSHTVFYPADNKLGIAYNWPTRYATYEKIYVAVWKQDPLHVPVEPTTDSHTHHLLAEYPTQMVKSSYEFPGACWGSYETDAPCFYVDVRFVNAAGVKSRPFPAGFRMKSCGTDLNANYPYMLSQILPGAEQINVTEWNSISKDTIGIYVPMSALPPMQNGANPVRLAPTLGAHATNIDN